MGLSEPRKRVKLSHDPRNLSWSQSSSSFGQRMMTKQGWKEGQSLGNRDSDHLGSNDVDRLAAARVGILFKDNNLGLGAKTKSKDVEAQRHGLDAFQGLLGRLNGKSDAELQKAEKKVEDRKLEMYARGRWGGMVFVKGGILLGSLEDDDEREDKQVEPAKSEQKDESRTEEPRTKEEKKQRKEERRKRREEKSVRKAAKKARKSAAEEESATAVSSRQPAPAHRSPTTQPPDEAVSSASSDNEAQRASAASGLKRKSSSDGQQVLVTSKSQVIATTKTRNGRHLLRGRNIQAKRMAFSDMKGLDEIFMRPG
ncbi:telomerase inhibitor [Elasticomyces elasticus]|uniref:Telomerase inhibitor n=1 Tax=Exophiala sideris TaxID=1016849 RepID=A0ABR0JBX6_9EURO|nr:telomerase inhibitor [Elasticomyces elasticus]KAK5026129.1 telomerase inhibitor [Exophiala sideris]KAK5032383.1 telomerase inhibitor [Exophiala sideris]KAK5059539.1 telomerase inhibitor [Exophiala sideris]KAK5186701.1 telomerase inhibitor [Eurotiomycetes sp. CCFEE 6388]